MLKNRGAESKKEFNVNVSQAARQGTMLGAPRLKHDARPALVASRGRCICA